MDDAEYVATIDPREKTDPDDIAAYLKHTRQQGYYTFAEAALHLADAAGLNLVHVPEVIANGGPLIHRKIIEVMRAVSPVAKAGKYEQGKTLYNYRRADDVFDAIHPAMAAAGVYPKPITREVIRNWGTTAQGSPRMEVTLRITFRFTAEDGSYEDVPIEVDNWNTSDKGIAAAHTVALRVALLQLFVVPTGDPDPDSIREETGTAPALTPSLVRYLVTQVDTATLDRLEELYGLMTAHVAPDSPVPGDADARVWWELWAARYLAEVEAASTQGYDALREIWKTVGPFGRAFKVGAGREVAKVIEEASIRWVERQKLAIDEVNGLISTAETVSEVDDVKVVIGIHLEHKRILIGDSLALLEVVEKKRARLQRQADDQAAQNLESWEQQRAEHYDGTQEQMNEEQGT